ncbi:MAG: DMT family transporter [Bacteroidales bacterium]|nr:DMT family transporter [Bacteroidales bacterium]
MPSPSTLRSDLLLLITAIIWGFAFVAQRMGMEHIGPFLFNGIRFALGALTLVIVFRMRGWMKRGSGEEGKRGSGEDTTARNQRLTANGQRLTVAYGLLLGLILFAGASFQQVGIVYTTAGNAGFITGLYIILVPIFGIFSGQKAGWNLWSGALLGAIGLYLLSVSGDFGISKGDLLVLLSAVFWAIHVLYTGWLAPRNSAIRLAITQYTVCSALSLFCAFLFESNTLAWIYNARYPILYGGILSVGIAYTLQIVAQKKATPSHAAIIMSLEAVFAVIGGMIILSETMTERKWIGCALMLCGMIMAQVVVKDGRVKR